MVIIKRGGVNDALICPVRGFLSVGCTPFFISTAEPSQAVSEGLGGWQEVACGGGAEDHVAKDELLRFISRVASATCRNKIFFCDMIRDSREKCGLRLTNKVKLCRI